MNTARQSSAWRWLSMAVIVACAARIIWLVIGDANANRHRLEATWLLLSAAAILHLFTQRRAHSSDVMHSRSRALRGGSRFAQCLRSALFPGAVAGITWLLYLPALSLGLLADDFVLTRPRIEKRILVQPRE